MGRAFSIPEAMTKESSIWPQLGGWIRRGEEVGKKGVSPP